MAELQGVRVKPAYGGWNTEASPDYCPELQGPLLENLLCRTGRLAMRGPIRVSKAVDHTYVNNVGITRATYGSVRGYLIKDNHAFLALNVEFLPAPERAANITLNSDDTFTVANTAPLVKLLPDGKSAQLGAFAYAAGSSVNFLTWNGVAAAPTEVTAVNGVHGFADIIDHTQRIFVGGGFLGSPATDGSAATIMYSDLDGPLAGAVTDWQDNTSGLTNKIQVGDDSDPIAAFGRAGRDLVIFKRNSIWLMTGSGPSTYAVRKITSQLGCVSKWTVANVDEGCYFASDRGYHYFDGANMDWVSRDIDPTIQAALRNTIAAQYGASHFSATQDGYQRAAYLPGGGIMLTMGIETFDPTAAPKVPCTGASSFQGVYDIKRKTWMKYSSDLHPVNAQSQEVGVTCLFRLGDRTIGFDGFSIFLLDEIMTPEAAPAGSGGIDVRQAGAVTNAVAAQTSAIPSKWRSRIVRLAAPLNAAQLHRILLDYRMDIGQDTPGWYVSVVRGDGTTAVAEYQVPGEASGAPTYQGRRRSAQDAYGEVIDVQIRVEWRSSTTSNTVAEIYDATVEFQPTSQRATV